MFPSAKRLPADLPGVSAVPPPPLSQSRLPRRLRSLDMILAARLPNKCRLQGEHLLLCSSVTQTSGGQIHGDLFACEKASDDVSKEPKIQMTLLTVVF